jgi:hypothetical protein
MSVIFGGPTVPLDHLVQLLESVKGSIPENTHNTLATKAFSNENFMSLLMDNFTDPRALFCLVLIFPAAKNVYEHYPRSFLKSTLSYTPQGLRQLAIGYLIFNEVPAKRKFTLSDASQVQLDIISQNLLNRVSITRTRLITCTHILISSIKSYRTSLSIHSRH